MSQGVLVCAKACRFAESAALITSSTVLTIRYMSMDACQSVIVVLPPGSQGLTLLLAGRPACRLGAGAFFFSAWYYEKRGRLLPP
jgi:hypothetical protein